MTNIIPELIKMQSASTNPIVITVSPISYSNQMDSWLPFAIIVNLIGQLIILFVLYKLLKKSK